MRRWFLLVACAGLAFQMTARADKPHYVFAFLNESGIQSSAEARQAFMNMLAAVKQRTSLSFNLEAKVIQTRAEMQTLIQGRKVHVAYSTARDFFVEAAQKWKARPFLKVTFDGKDSVQNCLYVAINSKFKTIKDLKGARASTYDSMDMYFGLRDLIKERPEIYFNPLNISPNAISSTYALTLGGTDVALIGDFTIQALKATNPGPIRKIRKIACIKPLLNAPLFLTANLPQAHVDQLHKVIAEMQAMRPSTDPVIRNIHQFLRIFKLRFAKTTPAEYQPLVDFYGGMMKKGYQNDYQSWYRYASKEAPSSGNK